MVRLLCNSDQNWGDIAEKNCGRDVSNWRSSSIQPSKFAFWGHNPVCCLMLHMLSSTRCNSPLCFL